MVEINSKLMSSGDLKTVIATAEQELKDRNEDHKQKTIGTIQELANSIDMQVDIYPKRNRKSLKGIKIEIKYRNPENSAEEWSGRGIKPRWMTALLEKNIPIESLKV